MSSDPIEVLRRSLQEMLDLRDAGLRSEVLPDRHELDIVRDARAALASLPAPKRKAGNNMEAEAGHVQVSEWVLVPREPTEAMASNMAVSLDYPSTRMGGPSPLMLRNVERAYRAMIAAAPKPESAEAWKSPFGACVCEGENACPGCNPNEAIELARNLATQEERLKHPPCVECGATSLEDAAGKCRCSGDKDDCHGCQLWPDDGTAPPRPEASAPVGVEAIADKIENDRTYWRSEAVADLRALAQQPAATLPRYGYPGGEETRPVPCPDGYWTPWHLAQQAVESGVFRNDGNSEARHVAHHADACTACGGSGHKADQQPAAVDEAMARKLKSALEAMDLAQGVMDYCTGDAWEREATEKDRNRFGEIYDELNPPATTPDPESVPTDWYSRVACPECGKKVSAKPGSLKQHLRDVHSLAGQQHGGTPE